MSDERTDLALRCHSTARPSLTVIRGSMPLSTGLVHMESAARGLSARRGQSRTACVRERTQRVEDPNDLHKQLSSRQSAERSRHEVSPTSAEVVIEDSVGTYMIIRCPRSSNASESELPFYVCTNTIDTHRG